MDNNDAFGFFLLFAFLFPIFIAFIDITRTKGFQFTSIMLPVILLIMIFVKFWGVFWVNLKGKGFMFSDGIKGTIVKGPVMLDGDRMKYYVAVYRQYLTPETKTRRTKGGYWFSDILSGVITIPVVDRVNRFKDIPAKNCGDPSGCVTYYGSVNGLPIQDSIKGIVEENDVYRNMVVKLNTIIKTLDNETRQLAQDENKQTSAVAQRLKSLVRDLKGQTTMVTPFTGMPPNNERGGF